MDPAGVDRNSTRSCSANRANTHTTTSMATTCYPGTTSVATTGIFSAGNSSVCAVVDGAAGCSVIAGYVRRAFGNGRRRAAGNGSQKVAEDGRSRAGGSSLARGARQGKIPRFAFGVSS